MARFVLQTAGQGSSRAIGPCRPITSIAVIQPVHHSVIRVHQPDLLTAIVQLPCPWPHGSHAAQGTRTLGHQDEAASSYDGARRKTVINAAFQSPVRNVHVHTVEAAQLDPLALRWFIGRMILHFVDENRTVPRKGGTDDNKGQGQGRKNVAHRTFLQL